ncbi:MAG TPA: protein kinase [Acidisarcina sp.]
MAHQQTRVEHVAEAALALKPADRAAFLEEACESDPDLKLSVENFLRNAAQPANRPLTPTPEAVETSTGTIFGSPGPGGIYHNGRARSNEHPASRLAIGDIVGDRFLVIRFLANGGMGEVYEVEDLRLDGVHLALKTVLPRIADDPAAQKRFRREVLLAREVVHPHLCPIYDIFHNQHRGRPLTFFTMKLVNGETVTTRIKKQGHIDVAEATHIVGQVASALTAIHEAGILHRDIKASNIMLDGVGEKVCATVMDFGLAHTDLIGAESTTTKLAGTPAYMSPELFRGESPAKSADIYAFGVVIYQMLTGRLPERNPANELLLAKDSAFHALPPHWQQLVRGCLQPDPARRYQSVSQAAALVAPQSAASPQPRKFTRRSMIQLGAGASAALATGIWLDWPNLDQRLEQWTHPLPKKRFVALMAWPADAAADPILPTILNSIQSRLARAEAYVKDLLIISSSDLAGKMDSPASPAAAMSVLGANLVLAASLRSDSSGTILVLQILDAATQRLIRKVAVTGSRDDKASLPDKASTAAAALLELPQRDVQQGGSDGLEGISTAAFVAFSQAEQAADQPNNAGLDAAIQKYVECLNLEPHFHLGYAKLSITYIHKYHWDPDPGLLDLARENSEKAQNGKATSTTALLSRALVYLYSGETDQAMTYFPKALKADPGNPDVLLYRAQAFQDLNRWADAEKAYREILDLRPNYWMANNELGFMLWKQAKYKEAAQAFDRAAMVAPSVALPLANLGTMYMEMGKHDQAIDALQQSIKRSPNADAYRNLGDMTWSDGNYKGALEYYRQSAALDPKFHLTWRDIADCYAILGQPSLVLPSYAKAASLLSDELAANPRNSSDWMTLAFYHAKLGASTAALDDIRNAEHRGASDVESQFMKVQALALLGKKEEATKLLLICMDRGLSPVEVDLAIDLKDIRNDPRYLSHKEAMFSRSK